MLMKSVAIVCLLGVTLYSCGSTISSTSYRSSQIAEAGMAGENDAGVFHDNGHSERHPDEEAAAIKMAAEHDADHKTHNVLWFTAGLAASAGCVFGAYIGTELAYAITDSTFDYDYSEYQPPEAHTCLGVPVASVTPIRFLGFFLGTAACGGLSYFGIYAAKPSKPLSERFIGKSPEYIAAYMAAYTSKARSNRIKSAAAGTVTGCGGVFLFIRFIAAY